MKNFTSTTPNGPKTLTDTWITPKWIIDAIGISELDPCGFITDNGRPLVETAKHYFTEMDDGLNKEWFGDVFVNFPYSQSKAWMAKMHEYNNGIVLCFARTETQAWQQNVKNATGVNFINKRISFLTATGEEKGNGNAPSALIAWGEKNYERIKKIDGIFCRIDV